MLKYIILLTGENDANKNAFQVRKAVDISPVKRTK